MNLHTHRNTHKLHIPLKHWVWVKMEMVVTVRVSTVMNGRRKREDDGGETLWMVYH